MLFRSDNDELALRPGMYVSVQLRHDLGARLQVPASAVVYTGPRRLVFLDLDDGHFQPQEVQIGSESDGWLEVRDGLQAGQKVATSGVFLIAAEARIRSAATYWEGTSQGEPAPAAPPNDAPPAHEHEAQPMRTQPSVKPVTAPAPAHEHAAHEHTKDEAAAHAAPHAEPGDKAVIYTCPMHPQIREPAPGKCPICGMTLVPAKDDPAP